MPTAPLCIRRAIAGIELLKDPSISQGEALRRGGFSDGIARNPSRNEATAAHCLKQSEGLERSGSPGKMLEKARQVMEKRLDTLLGPENLDRLRDEKLADISRTLDITEKWYSGKELPTGIHGGPMDPRERLGYMRDLLVEAVARGLVDQSQLARNQSKRSEEDEVIDVTPVSSVTSEDGSDNDHYLHSDKSNDYDDF